MDDNSFFSFCLRSLIEQEPGLTVCDVATSEIDLYQRIRFSRPDLLVIDLSVGRDGGYDVARSLRQAGVATPVLFVSAANPLPRYQLARVPDASFASKGGNPRMLIACIQKLMAAAPPAEAWDFAGSEVA